MAAKTIEIFQPFGIGPSQLQLIMQGVKKPIRTLDYRWLLARAVGVGAVRL